MNPKPVKDHTGADHPDVESMCRAWDVEPSTYRSRIRKGRTLEQALTGKWPGRKCRTATDHLGNVYPSVQDMFQAYGLTKDTWSNRLGHGWPLKRILTEPVHDNGYNRAHKGTARDHEGNEFPSIQAMCSHYGVKQSTFHNRLKRGLSLEQALTGPTRKGGPVAAIQDHAGRVFRSQKAMCMHYGLPVSTFQSRRRCGIPLEQALTTPHRRRTPQPEGPCGEKYRNWNAMCRDYGLPDFYGHASKLGTPELAARAVCTWWSGKDCGRYGRLEPIRFPWFKAVDADTGLEVVVHIRTVLASGREQTEQQEG